MSESIYPLLVFDFSMSGPVYSALGPNVRSPKVQGALHPATFMIGNARMPTWNQRNRGVYFFSRNPHLKKKSFFSLVNIN